MRGKINEALGNFTREMQKKKKKNLKNRKEPLKIAIDWM